MTTTYNVGSVFFAKDLIFGWCVQIINKFSFTPVDEKLGVPILRVLSEVCSNPVIPQEVKEVVTKALLGAEAAKIEEAISALSIEDIEIAEEEKRHRKHIDTMLDERRFLLKQLACRELVKKRVAAVDNKTREKLAVIIEFVRDNVLNLGLKTKTENFSEFVIELSSITDKQLIPVEMQNAIKEQFPMVLLKY